jgi:hypothetical protein
MIASTEQSLSEQRHALCLQLQAQRELIGQQLGPAASASRNYPRSLTMRLLTLRPGLIVSLLAGLATLIRAR